jgi:glucokinase-like ROK family protein
MLLWISLSIREEAVQILAGSRWASISTPRQIHCWRVRLGGTYIKSTVLDLRGKVLCEKISNVNPDDKKEKIVDQILKTIDSALRQQKVRNERIAGIGFTAPGAIDTDNGVCLYAPRHPKWKDVPIKEILHERYKAPCFVEHSNSSSALGEQWFGAGKNISDFLCVPIGTGISVGIIINGRIYRGYNGMAGEFGHTSIYPDGTKCICGRKGCLEEYASGRSLARQGNEIADRKKADVVMTSKLLCEAAESGDKKARKIFETMGQHLGIGLANLINILNPELIIISGGVSKASQFFLPSLEKALAGHAWDYSSRKIAISDLEDPVLMGAASLVLREIYVNGLLLKEKNGEKYE